MTSWMGGYLNRVRDAIANRGWAIVPVGMNEPGGVMLSYTVGQTERGLPELVVTGLDPTSAGELLNRLVRQARGEQPWQPGQQLKVEMPSGFTYPVWLSPVEESRRLTAGAVAARLYGPGRVALLQVIWPDRHGHFPGTRFYTLPASAQPVLRSGGYG